jgi:hypothetical protein
VLRAGLCKRGLEAAKERPDWEQDALQSLWPAVLAGATQDPERGGEGQVDSSPERDQPSLSTGTSSAGWASLYILQQRDAATGALPAATSLASTAGQRASVSGSSRTNVNCVITSSRCNTS